MTMIQLENTHKSYFDCFEDCITCVIRYYKRDYMYVLAESWKVELAAGAVKNALTDLMTFCTACNLADKYCGIKSDIRNFYKYEYMEEYLTRMLRDGKPVILSMDLYDVTWSEFYHNVHSPHFAVVYETLGAHMFKIFDVTKQMLEIEADLRTIFDGKACTVVMSQADQFKELDVKEIMDTGRQMMRRNALQGYDQLYYIAEHYFKENNSLFDFPRENVEAEAFVSRLVYFARQRLAFAEFLKHMSLKTGIKNYDTFITELGNLGAKWLTFRSKLMKVRLKDVFEEKKEELRRQWIALADNDKELYERFIQFDYSNKETEKKKIKLELLKAHVIELKSFYNANAFNSDRWGNKAGFDLNGYYYQMEKKDSIYEDYAFSFIFETESRLDHISCNRQSIPVMQKGVKAVNVIGSCENGDFSEEITFCYENNTESKSLIFPDWWEYGRFNESVVKKLNCFRMNKSYNQLMGECYIFSQILELDNGVGQQLESIQLPDCSNIHIFGLITYY